MYAHPLHNDPNLETMYTLREKKAQIAIDFKSAKTGNLSCFVFQENSSDMPKLTEQLAGPLCQMQECTKRIAKVSAEAKLEIDEETYLSSFKPHLMD
eukprot:bmy_22621T0